MTLDHCPHGHFLGSFDGRCAECFRDAAMWAAFVHDLRAELYLEELARTIEYAINMQIVADLNASVRAPHAEHSDRVLAKLRDMSSEESRQTFIDAGIFDESGNLTEPYRG